MGNWQSRLSLVLSGTLALDLLSKAWAAGALDLSRAVPLLGSYFQLRLSYNTGVAFGFFSAGGPALTLLTCLVICGLIGWVVRTRGGDLAARGGPLGLLLGGAVANLADHLLDGRVTDFLDLGWGALRWPTFNVADVCIVLSIGMLALGVYRPAVQDSPGAAARGVAS